jgi:hypothetical protein
LPFQLSRAVSWFLQSGIQESGGGVARYYRADEQRARAVSTEITGYAASAFVYLHSLDRRPQYLEAAVKAARFLTRKGWDPAARTLPFELDPPRFAYFFDCGIIVRGLLAAFRATGEEEFLETATALGEAMAADFAAEGGGFHPIVSLPGKQPLPEDKLSWSQARGCYQLKAAMAWDDLAGCGGGRRFEELYEQELARALRSCGDFLPGHPDPLKVMDRLHPFLYFLEGLLPRAKRPQCAAAIASGLALTGKTLREIAPRFERCDVYAQLLRMRLYADWNGAAPLDREAAGEEAERLAEFQAASMDARIDGGFYFGRRDGSTVPHVSPVSTAFALQALALWERSRAGCAQPHNHLLI